jgi:hypothetical protein
VILANDADNTDFEPAPVSGWQRKNRFDRALDWVLSMLQSAQNWAHEQFCRFKRWLRRVWWQIMIDPRSRAELDALPKDQLVLLADALKIVDANKLEHHELLDEILRVSGADRGLLGRARDLIHAVTGFKAQTPSAQADETPSPPTVATTANPSFETVDEPVPTKTLARIYLEQGHLDRARSVLAALAADAPNDSEIAQMQAQLDRTDGATQSARKDMCDVSIRSPGELWVRWECSHATEKQANRLLSSSEPTLRVVGFRPHPAGPIALTKDFALPSISQGFVAVSGVPQDCAFVVAIGIQNGLVFRPLVHAQQTVTVSSNVGPPAPEASARPETQFSWEEACKREYRD